MLFKIWAFLAVVALTEIFFILSSCKFLNVKTIDSNEPPIQITAWSTCSAPSSFKTSMSVESPIKTICA